MTRPAPALEPYAWIRVEDVDVCVLRIREGGILRVGYVRTDGRAVGVSAHWEANAWVFSNPGGPETFLIGQDGAMVLDGAPRRASEPGEEREPAASAVQDGVGAPSPEPEDTR